MSSPMLQIPKPIHKTSPAAAHEDASQGRWRTREKPPQPPTDEELENKVLETMERLKDEVPARSMFVEELTSLALPGDEAQVSVPELACLL